MRKERSSQTRKGRKKERKNDSHTRTALIAISPLRRSQPLVEPSHLSLSSFFSQFDRIWYFFFLGFVCVSVLRNEWYYIFVWQSRKCDRIWWFFSGFCLCFCIEKWMIYIRLATKKMWATSRKYVFYNIFKNTTKH